MFEVVCVVGLLEGVCGVMFGVTGGVLVVVLHLSHLHVLWCCLVLVSVVYVMWIHSLHDVHRTDPRVCLALVMC